MRRFSDDLVKIGFTDLEARQAALEWAPAMRALQKQANLQIGAVNDFIRHAFASAIGHNPQVFEKFKNDPVFRGEGVEGVLAQRRSLR